MRKALAGWILVWSAISQEGLAQEHSTAMPVVAKAVRSLVHDEKTTDPVVQDAAKRIAAKGISKEYLARLLHRWEKEARFDGGFVLPEEDEGDRLIASSLTEGAPLVADADVPKMALQAFRFDVVKKKSTILRDDIYAYFFVTDGIIPSGKVTSVYSGLKGGESFFFSPIDRAVFPGFGLQSAAPRRHLILDYGIVESNKGDIADMQKISDVIIDLVIAIYGTQHPETSPILIKIRREVKALARELIAMRKDDRLVTDSIVWDQAALQNFFPDGSDMVEFAKEYSGHFGPFRDEWRYRLNFRGLKE